MQATYGTPIDRESAYEVLNARLQAGAEAAARERAAEQAKADAARAREEEAPPASGGRPRREKSLFEQITANTMVRQMARTAVREITRSLFGTGRRR